ncbi:glycosyltransferase [Anaerolinea thermophila]|uniref:Glycosyltransferase n=1 Tax=Anaerolinea thermophila (strain DSM 14523 / JCM 11388 / NBRC 100420 / UNI-1) TaxID=926569 RepID=E8MYG9_ANATU|nr:glycosyltransferase [Anaerolinea thermophila]BAJ62114.1 putative glycosyltransferase [Anaerolinea thermophila UNI-1]
MNGLPTLSLFEHAPQMAVFFLTLGVFIALSNFFLVRRLGDYPAPNTFPRVSVLVPARNEEANIEACLRSLLTQDYPNYEVLALDDHSTDGTGAILARLAAEFPHLRVLKGEPLPPGWLGKHWACHQLAQAAQGDLLLFTDADTRHAPAMLRRAVAAQVAEDADLLTAFPYEEAHSWGEKLIIPVMGFGIFSFLPVALAQRLGWRGLSVTIGQFMLFRRSAFEAVGGFAAVRAHAVDDVALGRRILEQGFRWRLLDATEEVHCRMYHNLREAVDGFTKNVFAFFDYHVLLYVLAWTWVSICFLEPPLALMGAALNFPLTDFPLPLAQIAVVETLFLWVIAAMRFRFPPLVILFYPLSIALFVMIAVRSLVFTLQGKAEWKGRALSRPALRW